MLDWPELFRSLDEIVRSNMEITRDWYFGWLEIFTAMVVIGCILEVPEVIHEIWPAPLIERNLLRVRVIASIGLFLVIAGVAGELFFEARVSSYEGILQRFNEIILTDTQKETADAEAKAALATAASKDAITQVATAGARIAIAEAAAAEAKKRNKKNSRKPS
jgi:hypothetical protein